MVGYNQFYNLLILLSDIAWMDFLPVLLMNIKELWHIRIMQFKFNYLKVLSVDKLCEMIVL